MPLNTQPVGYFQSGNPETDEYLASYTFSNLNQLPYPGMLGQVCQYDQGSPGARNICAYQLVLAAAGVTPAKGDVLYWSDKSAYTVTNVATNGGELAGVTPAGSGGTGMTAAASGFWMIKKGDRPVHFLASPTSAPDATGKPVVGSSTTGRADCLALDEAQGAFPLIGTSLGATSSDLASTRVNIPDTY